jgi:hypothetical protein
LRYSRKISSQRTVPLSHHPPLYYELWPLKFENASVCTVWDAIVCDLYSTQPSTSRVIFEKATELLQLKWRAKNQQSVNAFLTYFRGIWCSQMNIKKRSRWLAGVSIGDPDHKNKLEDTYKWVKDEGTLHLRLGVQQFCSFINRNHLYLVTDQLTIRLTQREILPKFKII